MVIIYAPFTQSEVEGLKLWQLYYHPYTCKCKNDLTPSTKGWYCTNCDYTQNWCHDFSTEVKEKPLQEF